jgi:hypothetical protein
MGDLVNRSSVAAIAILVVSCALPDDYVKVDATGTSSAGGTGGTGGGGSGGGGAGAGGAPCIPNMQQNSCAAVLPLPYGGAGLIAVTRMRFGSGSVFSVGTFTGTVDFGGPQLSAGTATQGFVVEHDAAGGFVAQLALPEATLGSVLAVAFDSNLQQLAIGGSYAADGACAGAQGVFVRHLARDGATFQDVHAPVCMPTTATTVEIGGIGMSTTGYVNLAGAIDGTMDGLTSDGVDGFMLDVSQDGANVEAFLAGGSGDAAIRAILPNETDINQWLIAGDFSGVLQITFPSDNGPVTETRTADGMRDLFVAAIDRLPANPNLEVRAMGAPSGNHRMVGLSNNPAVLGEMHLLAMIEGSIDVGVSVAADPRPSALLLTFGAPDDGMNAYEYRGHYVISADQLDAREVVGAVGRIHVGGQAAGDLVVTKSDQPAITHDTVDPCVNDAFVLTLTPSTMSTQGQRCGDGQQRFEALGRYTDTLYAASITVPAGGSIDLGDGIEMQPAQRTFLLREP